MTPEQAVRSVNLVWEYKSDGSIDKWGFTTPGDCENYSLMVLKNIYGSRGAAKRALIGRKSYIWYAENKKGDGHAVLEHQGKFVDNVYMRWMDDKSDMDYDFKFRYSRIQLIAKLGFGALLPG